MRTTADGAGVRCADAEAALTTNASEFRVCVAPGVEVALCGVACNTRQGTGSQLWRAATDSARPLMRLIHSDARCIEMGAGLGWAVQARSRLESTRLQSLIVKRMSPFNLNLVSELAPLHLGLVGLALAVDSRGGERRRAVLITDGFKDVVKRLKQNILNNKLPAARARAKRWEFAQGQLPVDMAEEVANAEFLVATDVLYSSAVRRPAG